MIGFLLDAYSVTCSHSGLPRSGLLKRLAASADPEVTSTHDSLATHRFTLALICLKKIFSLLLGVVTTGNVLSCWLIWGLMTNSRSEAMSRLLLRSSSSGA